MKKSFQTRIIGPVLISFLFMLLPFQPALGQGEAILQPSPIDSLMVPAPDSGSVGGPTGGATAPAADAPAIDGAQPADGSAPAADPTATSGDVNQQAGAFQTVDQPARTIDYTDQLFDITDEGIFDTTGKIVSDPQILEQAAQAPAADAAAPASDTAGNEPVVAPVDPFEAYRQTIIANWGGERAYTERRLQGVKDSLNQATQHFKDFDTQIKDTQEKLAPLQDAISTLNGAVGLLNDQLREIKTKITDAELQIASKQIAMRDLMKEIHARQIELSAQQRVVLDFVSLLYTQDDQFFDFQGGGVSTVKLLLADASTSDSLQGSDYLSIMEQTGRKVFYDLESKTRALQDKQDEAYHEQKNLARLYLTLSEQKLSLEQARQSKKALLDETHGQEDAYQKLLDDSIQQQIESSIAIQNLKDNMTLIEGKLKTLESGIDQVVKVDSQQGLDAVKQTVKQQVQQGMPSVDFSSKKPFIWPVVPLAITAYFHDAHYPKKWGTHQAVDIRTPQFTPIHAPANGYVFQTKDNGMGYSYIILAHKNNLVTVYGHVTQILVKPGTLVKQGDIIGLSGGTPGTKGAGMQTTGPHLHFEVYLKGEHVDPLDYLPVHQLPEEYIPARFLK